MRTGPLSPLRLVLADTVSVLRCGFVSHRNLSGLRLSLPDGRRGEAVRDGGRFEPVRRVELAQDVRDVDAGRLDADDERRRDLAVRAATCDEGQDLRLARCQAESLAQTPPSIE